MTKKKIQLHLIHLLPKCILWKSSAWMGSKMSVCKTFSFIILASGSRSWRNALQC